MVHGTWLHYPYSGGAWEQDDGLLSLAQYARRSWYVFGYMPKNKIKWSPEDADFIAWVNNGDD